MSTVRTTTAWIFLAIHYADGETGASRRDVESMADAINHAIPTHQELEASIQRLIELGLVAYLGKTRLKITPAGQGYIENARSKSDTAFGVWVELSKGLPDQASG